MSEIILETINSKPEEQIETRLQAVLQETRKDEAQIRRILEIRRLKRRVPARKVR